jgi:hypothetical protein
VQGAGPVLILWRPIRAVLQHAVQLLLLLRRR